MAPTSATYFYMTDQRGTDRTKAAPPESSSASTDLRWRYR